MSSTGTRTEDWQENRDLDALHQFQEHIGARFLAPGFELLEFGNQTGIRTWSQDPEFLGALHTFAQASASGSQYALWRMEDRGGTTSCPVVVFGDEGGLGVVARSLPELFQQVAAGQALSVGDYTAWFHHVEDRNESDGVDERFLVWLADRYGLDPAEDPNAMIDVAVRQYGELFARWMGRFVDDEDFVDDFLMDIGVGIDDDSAAGVGSDTTG